MAPFLWLNHQVKQLPGFTDQVIIREHTTLKTSHYRMLQPKRLKGTKTSRTKDSQLFWVPYSGGQRKSLYDVNPCSSSLKLTLSRLSVYWTAPCLSLCHLDGNVPLFVISIFSELVELQCTVGSYSASVECPLRTDPSNKGFPGHFSIRSRRIPRWKEWGARVWLNWMKTFPITIALHNDRFTIKQRSLVIY